MPLKLTILQFLVPGLVTLVALAAESPTPSPRLSYGMELLRQGRVDEAIEVLDAENKAHPNNPILLNTFGAAFCLKNRPGDALPLFQEALRLNQGFRPALKNLAIAEFNLERYDSAISHFETLLRFPETRAEANLFLGMIASARLRDGDAIRYFGARTAGRRMQHSSQNYRRWKRRIPTTSSSRS